MSAAKRRPKSNSPGKNVRGEIRISARKLARLLEAQTRADSLLRKFARQQTRARAARLLFKPLQRERGKLIFVGLNGRRIPPGANRKGYALYVTKTGKKRLVVRKALKNPYAPRKLSEVKLSGAGNLRRVEKVFERSRLEKISRGKVTRASRARKEKASGAEKLWEKKSGEAVAGEYSERFRPPAGKAFDEKAVSQMARSIARAFASQKSRRLFLITALAWVRGEYGDDVVQVQFSLGRSERYFF